MEDVIDDLEFRAAVIEKLTRAMAELTSIETGRLDAAQKLLLADVMWPIGELADTFLETPTGHMLGVK